MIDRPGVGDALDAAVGPIKAFERGATAGEVLVSPAQALLCDHDSMAGLDRCRAEAFATGLSAGADSGLDDRGDAGPAALR